jgi:flagellar assembly protein FliH
MACKIADDSIGIQPVLWASASVPAPSRTNSADPVPQEGRAAISEQAKYEELDRLRQVELTQARKLAFEEGAKKARDEAAAEIKNIDERLARTLRDLVVMKRRMRNEAESDVVQLSLAIAKRILHRELTVDPESIQGVVHAALQKLQNREIACVRVCPSALETVRSALERAGVTTGISVIADPKMHNGDLVFETTLGELDASVEAQLKEIARGFSDRLGLSC